MPGSGWRCSIGVVGWLPLLVWNLGNAGAGLRFQVWDRNPWAFHADGAAWIAIQFLLVTPVLFVLLLATLREAWRRRRDDDRQPWGLIAGVAMVSVLGYFLLGFFVDDTRVSFHWPLSGWLVLVIAAPVVMVRWPRAARLGVLACRRHRLAGRGLSFLAAASQASSRFALAGTRFYPADLAGRQEIVERARQLRLDPKSTIVAGDFALAAHACVRAGPTAISGCSTARSNHKHGRAAQLQQWGLQLNDLAQAPSAPLVLFVDDTATAMKDRLVAYHQLCEVFGALPAPEVMNVDHGRKRYLIYRIESLDKRPGCTAPALAWLDSPAAKASVPSRFTATGWAFKDGVGLSAVEVTVDGTVVASANYGEAMPNVAEYWRISTDPRQPMRRLQGRRRCQRVLAGAALAGTTTAWRRRLRRDLGRAADTNPAALIRAG